MFLFVPEIKPRFFGHQVRTVLTMLTELSWLGNCVYRHVNYGSIGVILLFSVYHHLVLLQRHEIEFCPSPRGYSNV